MLTRCLLSAGTEVCCSGLEAAVLWSDGERERVRFSMYECSRYCFEFHRKVGSSDCAKLLCGQWSAVWSTLFDNEDWICN